MANPNTDRAIMGALTQILPGYPVRNTRVGQLGNPVIIQNEYSLLQSGFPAVHLETGKQRHQLVTGNGYTATLQILVTYYDRWDAQSASIDSIRQAIDADLQQMMLNVQSNSSLALNGEAMAVSIPTIDLSEYKGELDEKTATGLTLVKRTMTLTVVVLPYDVP